MNDYIPKRPCVICGNTKKSRFYCEIDNLVYVKCECCSLTYVDQLANIKEIKKAHGGGNFKSIRRKLFGSIRKMRSLGGYKHFLNRAHKIFDFVKQRHLASDDQKTMLDIGCNKGFLLKVAIEENFNVFGVELVPEVIRPFCNTYPKFKDQIFSEKFQTVSNRFEDKYFDIITAIDVVEHFEDPLSDLKSIRRLLKDDGVFIVQTPNIECENSKKLGCNWKALKPLEHMHLFSENNFITFGKMAGFSKITTYKPFEEAAGNFVAVLYP